DGTGLGLSIAQRIISEHQGRLEVESSASEGAEFIITLPLGDLEP
ncbi:MAG: ATP-binding protein, partial [Syntrophobacterales bacterium]